jgi:NADH-quinone oxidoreductase subunit E
MNKIATAFSFFNKRHDKPDDKKLIRENPCIECNICMEVCDKGLWPSVLLEDIKLGRFEDCIKHGIAKCNDCGDCTAECPMSIPLFKYLRFGKVLSFYRGNKSGLIPILLSLQSNFGYLPEDMISHIARYLNLSVGHIRSVASFYKSLRLKPPGRKHVCICRGTACHISGAPGLTREVESLLGIKESETSADNEYTLDTVACVGCCALAPVMTVNSETYGKMNSDKIKKLFNISGLKEEIPE